VIRNLVFKRHRSRARRRRHEENAARPELDTSTPAELVERADLQRRVTEAVLELDEPYRTTVLRRYFEDRSPAEIAERDGVPAATVRIRLHRAREQLRNRLDGAYGGERGKWRAVLLPLAGPRGDGLLASAAGGTASTPAALSTTGLGASSAMAKTLIVGGTIVTHQSVIAAAAVGIITLAAGFGIGRFGARMGPEEAMDRFQLVEAGKVAALESRNRQVSTELQQLRAERSRVSGEKDDLLAKVSKLEAELAASKEQATAADAAAAGHPLPVAFGKYAELEGIQKADWPAMGLAVRSMQELMVELIQASEKGDALDPELQKKVQAENAKLVALAASVMGKIPTHSPINGEFTHPLILSNLMGSVLEAAGVPLSKNQKAVVAGLGAEYEQAYAGKQAGYNQETSQLEKTIDELELKRDCMLKIRETMTAGQRSELTPAEIQDFPMDVLSPGVSTQLLAQARTYRSAEDVRSKFPAAILKNYEIDPSLGSSLNEAFDSWYKEVEPLLTPRAKQGGPRLDETATAGRAQVNLLKRILELPDLSDKTRKAIIADHSWWIPMVVEKKDGN